MLDMNTLIFVIGCATTIVVALVGTLCLRADMRAMELRLRAAMGGVVSSEPPETASENVPPGCR